METRNPTYNHVGTIDCEINHPVYGWLPFTATPDDVEPLGREIFAATRASAGKYVAPPVNLDRLAASLRDERTALLSDSDWTQMPDAPVDQAAWATYRQALRDVPQQAGFPKNILRPTAPQKK